MTLKPLALRSAPALLNSPIGGSQAAAGGAPTLRDHDLTRAQRADSPGSRADFADTLRERADARAEADALRSGKKEVASTDEASDIAAEVAADGSDGSVESGEARGATGNATPTEFQPAEPQSDAAASAGATANAAAQVESTSSSIAAEIKTKPVTIQDLNALLLQGQSAPRFAMVAPELVPSASARIEPRSRTRDARSTPTTPSAATNAAITNEIAPSTGAAPANAPKLAPAKQTHEAAPTHAASQAATKPETPTNQIASPAPALGPVPTSDRPVPPPVALVSPRQTPESPAAPTPAVGARTADAHTLLDRLGGTVSRPDAPTGSRAEQQNQAFASQLQRGLAAALNQKTGAVTIRLTPETLGQLKIQVKLSEGSLTAAFEVASAKTRDTLTRSLDTLRQGLKDKGIESSEFKVTLATPLPQRDLGLEPVQHPTTPTPDGASPSTPDGQFSTAHDGSGRHHHADHARATFTSGATSDAAETAVDLAALSPDLAESDLGRSRYVALPDGRLGLVALA